jgi:spore germination cell wall hydrolase CwlJ-like protein
MLFGALAVAFGGNEPDPVAKLAPPAPLVDSTDFDESLHCLALNIYHEARSEPEAGQLAVAAVTLNRVRSRAFPDSVCGVVKQGGEQRHRCQFSWWCDGKSDLPTEAEAWKNAQRISRLFLLGLAKDPTNEALYYHATYVKPRWSQKMELTARIDQHVFYRPKPAAPSIRVAALN